MPKRSIEDFGSIRQTQILEASDRRSFSEVFQVTDSTFLVEEILFARVIITTNLTTIGGLITHDGVSLNAGDYALVNEQDNPEENGFYMVQSGLWTRVLEGFIMKSGIPVIVREGTTYANTLWIEELEFPVFNAGLTETHWVQVAPPADPITIEESDTYSIDMNVAFSSGVYYIEANLRKQSTDSIDLTVDADGLRADLQKADSNTIEHQITTSGLVSHVKIRTPSGNTVQIYNDDFGGLYAEVIHNETNTISFSSTDATGLKADLKYEDSVTTTLTDSVDGLRVDVNYTQSPSVEIDEVDEVVPVPQKGLRARVRKHDTNTFVWNDDHVNGINGEVQVTSSDSITMTNDDPDGVKAEISTLWQNKINKWWKVQTLPAQSGSATSYAWLMPQDLGDLAIPEGVYAVYVRVAITQNNSMPMQPANNASSTSLVVTTPSGGATTVAQGDNFIPAVGSQDRLIVNELKGFRIADFRGDAPQDRQIDITVNLPNGTGTKSAVGTLYIWEIDLTENEGSYEAY